MVFFSCLEASRGFSLCQCCVVLCQIGCFLCHVVSFVLGFVSVCVVCVSFLCHVCQVCNTALGIKYYFLCYVKSIMCQSMVRIHTDSRNKKNMPRGSVVGK